MAESTGFHLQRPLAPLPGPSEFDPGGGDLDALHAWKNFGGLSLDQAFRLFLENPLHYQEDFMFMGPAALDYYLPVIDRYLRSFRRDSDDDDDGVAWILGAAMVLHLGPNKTRHMATTTILEIGRLADFVIREIDRYAAEPCGQRRILETWSKAGLLAQERTGGT